MSIELISPFPDESLPKLWLWMKPYQSKTEFAGQDVESFMEIERRRPSRLKTWGVMLDIELGGYIELQPHGDRTAVLDMISKKSFFASNSQAGARRGIRRGLFLRGFITVLPVRKKRGARENVSISWRARLRLAAGTERRP
jgi:hypothetical protein